MRSKSQRRLAPCLWAASALWAARALAVSTWSSLAGQWRRWPIFTAKLVLVLAIAVSAARAGPEQPVLTPDQQAIVDKIAKGTNPNNVLYTEASTDHIGTEVRLPFRRGKY